MLHRLFLTCSIAAIAVLANAGQADLAAQDVYGDPLPPGAIARLGTVRFRHDVTIVFAAFLPDGKSVVSVGADGVVHVWEFPSGKELRRFEAHAEKSGAPAVQVSSASLSPDGKHLTVFCGDGFMRVWDWSNAKQLGAVANVRGTPTVTTARASLGGVSSVVGSVYSPDGKTLMLAARALQFVDLPSGKEIGPCQAHMDPLTSIRFAADGRQVLTQDIRSTRTWDASTGKNLGTTTSKLPGAAASSMIISPDGRIGLAVSRLGTSPFAAQAAKAALVEIASGKELGTLDFGTESSILYRKPMLFSPDGKMLAVGGSDFQPKIELYEIPSTKKLRTLDIGSTVRMGKGGKGGFAGPGGGGAGFGGGGFGGPRSFAQKMVFSPDSKAIAFQIAPGAPIVALDTVTGRQIGALPLDAGGPDILSAFSPDRRCLVLENSDGTVTPHELATGEPRRAYGNKLTPGAAVKTDPADMGELLAGFGKGSPLSEKSRVSVAISPDGKLLALAAPDGAVHVWDVLTGKELKVLKGHTGAVNAMAFAPGGKMLASASNDMTSLIWDMTKIARPPAPDKALKAGDLEAWWQALADKDAAKAFAAIGEFASVPNDAVAWIKDRIKPEPALNIERVQELIRQLDDEQFKVRDKATSELLKIGELVLPILDKALSGEPSLESQKRLEALRGKLTATVLTGEKLQAFRAVEVLELIGTPRARQVLEMLALGAPGARITMSAQAALKR